MASQPLFPGLHEQRLSKSYVFDKNIIEDRGSKYSVSSGIIALSEENLASWMKRYLSGKYYRKATHNSYAYRFYDDEGFLIEGKNDDGETGAGKIILDHMQRENLVDAIIVVTRYFGGTRLQSDRFRHLVSATHYVIDNHIT